MKDPVDRPIGVFDSGLGGLTVVSALREKLPGEDIIYFGDTARVPYGNKSRATIRRFSDEVTGFLTSKGVKFVVVACNTASSLALSYLKRKYDLPVTGVIKSGVKEALESSPRGKVGVIATKSTINSGAYEKEFGRIFSHGKLHSCSCPLFVPLVENSFLEDEITRLAAEKYLSGLKKLELEALILGCTHYPLIKGVIQEVMGAVKLIDSSEAVSREAEYVLKKRSLLSARKRRGRIKCFITDDVSGFKENSGMFLEEAISVSKVEL